MRRFQRITVSLSLTASDFDVLRYANLIALLGISREFHFVHVLPRGSHDVHETATAAIRLSNLLAARFEPFPEDLLVYHTVRQGDRCEQLLELTREHDSQLVLVAGRDSAGTKPSLAARLAQCGSCSVWMVPSSANGSIGRILTLIDFSSHSQESLSLAAGLARLSGLEECLALHVGERTASIRRAAEQNCTSNARHDLTAFSQFLKSVNTYGQAIIPLLEQDPNLTNAVVASVRRQAADLIVIGPSSTGRFDEESCRILDESPVPVLLVQPEASARMIEPVGRA